MIFIFTTLLVVILVVSPLDIIITSNIINESIKVDLNIKYVFGIINFKLGIYPKKKNKKNKKKKSSIIKKKLLERSKNTRDFSVETIIDIYKFIRKIKIKELYCNLSYGNVNLEFTSFILVFINIIYSNIAAYLQADKMFLKVDPNYASNYINGKILLKVRITYKDVIRLIKLVYEIIKKNKEVARNGSSKFNKKSYGNNS